MADPCLINPIPAVHLKIVEKCLISLYRPTFNVLTGPSCT